MPRKPKKQGSGNPFPFSDGSKRYHTYDYWLKTTFGGKCAKIPLDAGLSCPNLDGACGTGGCIYCSGRGSGDFAESSVVPLREQYDRQREFLSGKWPTERCIPYFQARTNTYAPVETLRPMFEQALTWPGVVGMNIATRADCLPPDTVSLLAELSEKTVLTVELGLQTAHDATATTINRGHTFADFLEGYYRLREGAPKALICIHLIMGLPDETEADMLETVKRVAELKPDQVKIHLLHVLQGTAIVQGREVCPNGTGGLYFRGGQGLGALASRNRGGSCHGRRRRRGSVGAPMESAQERGAERHRSGSFGGEYGSRCQI